LADFADVLITELDKAESWPLPREVWVHERVRERQAFRRGDRDVLMGLARWNEQTDGPTDRDYIVDPLARNIARAYADFLFSEDLEITAGTEQSQEELEEVAAENRLPAQLHRVERLIVSEGERWWKIHVNRDVAGVPLLGWVSRLSVVPCFYGDRLLACAFVSECGREQVSVGEDEQPWMRVWRHVEVHADLRVVNVLYEGTSEELGDRVALDTRPETAEVEEEWNHGLPMLAGRLVNDIDDDPTLGESEYDQVRDELLALNEAMTIAVENARLTGKDRIFAAGRLKRGDGTFDSSMEVFELDEGGGTMGEGAGKPPIFAVEKVYDAEPLWLHIRNLVSTTLNRVGLVPQFVGQDADGRAESGTAIRLRFLPTTNAAKGKAREWDAYLPVILDLMLQVAGLSEKEGGFGRSYQKGELPSVERGDVLPVDEGETIGDNATAVASEIRSREIAIRAQHPDWSDEQVNEEIGRIEQDVAPPELPEP
jgi:hypothetical protein